MVNSFDVYDAQSTVECTGWVVNGSLVLNRNEIIELVSVDDLLTGNVNVIEGVFKGDFLPSKKWDEIGHYGTLWDDDGNAYIIRAGHCVSDYSDSPEGRVV